MRLVKVVVPAYELYGGFAMLECQYELNANDNNKGTGGGGSSKSSRASHYSYDSNEQSDEGETLYSVKWYKDNEEFYRYVPKANPPQHSYKVEGIRVDVSHKHTQPHTNSHILLLYHMNYIFKRRRHIMTTF